MRASQYNNIVRTLFLFSAILSFIPGCQPKNDESLELTGRPVFSWTYGDSTVYYELSEDKLNGTVRLVPMAPEVEGGALSPDCRRLVFARDGKTYLFDLISKKETELFLFKSMAHSWSPSGRQLVFIKEDPPGFRNFCLGDISAVHCTIWGIPSREYSSFGVEGDVRRIYPCIGKICWIQENLIAVEHYQGGFPQWLRQGEVLEPNTTTLVSLKGGKIELKDLENSLFGRNWKFCSDGSWVLSWVIQAGYITGDHYPYVARVDREIDKLVFKKIEVPLGTFVDFLPGRCLLMFLEEERGRISLRFLNPETMQIEESFLLDVRPRDLRRIGWWLQGLEFRLSTDERRLLAWPSRFSKDDVIVLFDLASGSKRIFRNLVNIPESGYNGAWRFIAWLD